MNQHTTAASVEAESARVRAELIVVGRDIRAHVDPAVLVDSAKAAFERRSKDVPTFLRRNASPIGLVLLGGAFGASVVGLFAPSRKASAPEPADPAAVNVTPPNAKAKLEAALLSTVGVGLGYAGGMFIPTTTAEESLLGEPKAVLSARLDEFLNQHTRGMKLAAANLFGASRLSAAMLIALAAAADALGISRRNAGHELL